jgi:hypothetical protein
VADRKSLGTCTNLRHLFSQVPGISDCVGGTFPAVRADSTSDSLRRSMGSRSGVKTRGRNGFSLTH